MVTEIEKLYNRVDKIEKEKDQEVLALVEILSNATFFGEIRKENCEYAKNGQCGYFILEMGAKNKIPIATECKIKQCTETSLHCHIELSNISCTLYQKISNYQEEHPSKITSKISGDAPQNKEFSSKKRDKLRKK